MGNIPSRLEEHEECQSEVQRAKQAKVMIVIEAVVVIFILAFCFRQRTPEITEPTPLPTATVTPSPSPTFTPSPSPTVTPTPTPSPIPYVVKEVDKGHPFKPFTGYWAYNLKGSAQHKLQKVARTDERTGIRVVTDPYGVERYCVALGTFWAGGHPEHIGRCLDVVMVNGSVLPCVLADVKRQEDAKGNKYGRINNDVLEFIVDERYLPSGVYGDMQRAGAEFEGDVKEMIIYDFWIEGFGK